MSDLSWLPTMSIPDLRERAQVLTSIRHFFATQGVLEVETPSVSHACVTDIHLAPFKSEFIGPSHAHGCAVYFMTSPEFHMKRLLAAGAGSIFQLCKAFRNEESGRYHNPEFTILEWYRVGFDHHQLMDDVDALLQLTLSCDSAEKITYQQAFCQWVGVCPLEGTMASLKAAADQLGLGDVTVDESDRDTLLQLLFNVGVEPNIGQTRPTFVYNFPASQAALAKISPCDLRVAERFEVYFKGIELANGFHELDDPVEQRARFVADNRRRELMGQEALPVDEHLIQALQSGLPPCAGVALGIDRLLMLALNKSQIRDVMAFAFANA
jgi:lysyl-tRNA synthetase class 2